MSLPNPKSTKETIVAKGGSTTENSDQQPATGANVTKLPGDKSTVDVLQCSPPSCIPNGCIRPEQYYACDRQTVKTLVQYVSPEEREKITLWLDALQKMTLDEDELSQRSMYLTCILLLLRSGQLVPPFTRTPPKRPLKALRDVIDKHLYKKVQIECRKRRIYEPVHYEQPNYSVEQKPAEFFQKMPTPDNGIFCYGAAFSSM